jgi:hypothetical protein
MKRRLLYQLFWLTVCVGLIGGGRIMAQSITTIGPSSPATCVSPGATLTVPVSVTGVFTPGNVFTFQLSDNAGNFPVSPTILESKPVAPAQAITYSFSGSIPANATAGNYRIRVVSSAPVRTSTTLAIGISPNAPTAGISSPAGLICPGSPVSLTASGSNLKWFAPIVGLVANGGNSYSFTTAGAGTYGYTVTQLVGLCESPVQTISVVVAAKSPAPVTPAQSAYCLGVPGVPLVATGTNLRWYGANVNNPSPGTTPTVPPTTVSGPIGPFYVSQNTNGCESDRIGIPVTVNTLPAAPNVATPQPYCQSSTVQQLAPNGAGFRWYNAGGTLLANNGAAPQQSLSTPGSTTYLVSALGNGCESATKSPLVVTVTPSPATLASVSLVYCETARPAALTVNGTNVRWYSDAAGTIQLVGTPAVPVNPNTYTYYVRQFDGSSCSSSPSVYTIRVAATPAAPVVAAVSRCLNEPSQQLTATGTNLNWFDSGGAALPSAPSPPTSATGTLNYLVSQTSSDGCVSSRATITVTINGIPTSPIATAPAAFCEGKPAPVLSASGAALRWYSLSPTGGTFTTSPTPVNNLLVGTSNYYVSQVVNGCESSRTAIPVTVKSTPAAPGVANVSACLNAPSLTLTASTVPNATLVWATTPQGATFAAAPVVPNNVVQIYPYHVLQRLNGCDGPQVLLTATVKPLPAAPTTTNLDLCQNGASRPIQASGTNLRYYDPAGNGSSGAPSPPTNTVGTSTYQVTQTLNECEGPRAPLVVTVSALPAPPSVTDVFYCLPQADQPAQSVPPVTAIGQNLRWYNSDGNQFSGAPTPPINQVRTFSFQVSQTIGSCEGSRATLNVTIRTTPAPVVSVTSVSYCRNDQTTPLQATAEPGGSLRWIDPNGNLTNDAPAPITLNPTAPGGRVFYVYQIGTNGCYSPRSQIRLFVNTNPTLSLLGSTTVNLGRTTPLQLRFTGVPPFSFALSDGTAGTSNDTTTTVNVMPAQTTVFQVASVTNICGQGLPGNPATATVTVRIPTISTGALPSSVACVGTGLSVPFTTTGEFNQGNIFRVEITTDTTSRTSTTVGVGNGQVGPIAISLPQSLSAGSYYVRVVGSNPGIVVLGYTSPVRLTVRGLPTAIMTGTQDIYEGATAKVNVALTGEGPWTFVYADSLRSTTVATNANPHVLEVRPLKNSIYRLVSVVNNCGEGSVSGTANVKVLPLLGVEDDQLGTSVKAYPVPTTAALTVEIDLPLQRNPAALSITDMSGKPILQRTTRDRQTTLDLSQHPPGIYILNVKVGDKQTTRRVLKN